MKVKKITNGNMMIDGVTYMKDVIVVVNKKTFDYIKATFPNQFEFLDEPKKQTKKEEVKSRAENKVKEVEAITKG